MSAHDYYVRMQNIHENILEVEKEKEVCDKVLPIVEKLTRALPNIKDNLVNTENNFKNGGFLSDGETYDKGNLKKWYNTLQENIDSLNETINKLKAKISNLNIEIARLKNDYANAQSDYQKAIIKELHG